MQREIRFRAWDKENNRMWERGVLEIEMQPFDLCKTSFFEFVGIQDVHMLTGNLLTDYILMQWSGVKDINGKYIFEDDIVKCLHTEGMSWQREHESIGVVTFSDQGMFTVKCLNKGSRDAKDEKKRYFHVSFKTDRQFEVIGNIHQNKPLLP